MIKKYKPTAFFDAISGEFPATVLALMPEGSTMYVYGALSMKPIVHVDSGGLIFKNHSVKNFWIPTWLKNTKKEVLLKWISEIVSDMLEGGKVFGSKVVK
jgi:NADPH:quinone reductase-like Zn-dependent oxidoreductase